MADTKEIIFCPACKTEMKKIFIKEANRNIDICEKCGGIFFDNQEFKRFDEQHENIEEIEATLTKKEYAKVDTNLVRECPYCTANMVKTNYDGIEIDECYTCGAKFLDNQELQKYRANFATDKERTDKFNKKIQQTIKETQLEADKDAKWIKLLRKMVLLGDKLTPATKKILESINDKTNEIIEYDITD